MMQCINQFVHVNGEFDLYFFMYVNSYTRLASLLYTMSCCTFGHCPILLFGMGLYLPVSTSVSISDILMGTRSSNTLLHLYRFVEYVCVVGYIGYCPP